MSSFVFVKYPGTIDKSDLKLIGEKIIFALDLTDDM